MATGKVIPLQELKDPSSVVASVCSPLTGDQDAQHQAAASPVSTPVTVPLGSAYSSTAAGSPGHLPVKPAPEACTRTREALMSDLLTTKGDRLREACPAFYNLLWVVTWRPVALLTLTLGVYMVGVEGIAAFLMGHSERVAYCVANACEVGSMLFLCRITTGSTMGHLGRGMGQNPFIKDCGTGTELYELSDASLYYADAYYKAMGEKGRRAARAAHAEEERVGLQAAMRLVLLIARSFQAVGVMLAAVCILRAPFIRDPLFVVRWSGGYWVMAVSWLAGFPATVMFFGVYIMFVWTQRCMVATFIARLLASRAPEDKEPCWKDQREFVEEYLLVQEAMRTASRLCEMFLAVGLMASALLFMGFTAGIVWTGNFSGTPLGSIGAAIFLMLLFLPSELNARLARIPETIKAAGPEDWKHIGTRDGFLLPYVQSNLVLYTVFGFPITYGWLLTLGSGVLSTILLTTISTYVGA